MKRTWVVLAGLLAATAAHASWNREGGPGGGGNWRSVDVNSSGRMAIASDVSGFYWVQGNTGGQINYLNGLAATSIYTLRWDPFNPSVLLIGTGNGLYRSSTSGASSAPLTSFIGDDVTALGWATGAGDSGVVACMWARDTSNASPPLYFSISTATGSSAGNVWTTVTRNPAGLKPALEETTDAARGGVRVRVPIKILFDPTQTGSSRDIYVLFGDCNRTVQKSGTGAKSGAGNMKEIWKSVDGGSNWSRIAPTGYSPMNPIDLCFRDASTNILMVTASDDDAMNSNSQGYVWRYHPGDDTWNRDSPDSALGGSRPTGAVFSKSGYWYVYNVQRDNCPHGQVSSAGIWRVAHAEQNHQLQNSWSRFDDGTNWESYYGPCKTEHGEVINNVAQSISADGIWQIGAQNVWKYDTDRFLRGSTTPVSSGWASLGLDNTNCTSLASDGTTIYAGHYDIGLWKRALNNGTPYWIDQNPSPSCTGSGSDTSCAEMAWTGKDAFGGNVNSMLFVGSDAYVTEAVSSKGKPYRYNVWKKTSGGSWTKLSDQPPAVQPNWNDASHIGAPTRYLRSLVSDGSNLYTTCNGYVSKATLAGGAWSQLTTSPLPSYGGFATLAYRGGTLLAGGWAGIYRSTDGGSNWSLRDNLNFSSDSDCLKDTACVMDDQLHQESFSGIHDFLPIQGPGGAATWWLAAVHMQRDDCSSGNPAPKYGLLLSRDDGQNWVELYHKRFVRGLAKVDTCPGPGQVWPDTMAAFFLTSGEGFSSGPNSNTSNNKSAGFDSSRGVVRFYLGYRDYGAQGNDGAEDKPLVRYGPVDEIGGYGQGNRISADPTGAREVFMSYQGYGVMHDVLYQDDSACEIELTGPGGMRAHRSPDERGPANVGRASFTVQEAAALVRSGAMELFDVSGRRTRQPAPGIYFSVLRDKAGVVTKRRTVLVTP